MNADFWVELVKVVGIIASAIYAYLASRRAGKAVEETVESRREMNGRLSQLLKSSVGEAHAEGRHAGEQEERERSSHHPPKD